MSNVPHVDGKGVPDKLDSIRRSHVEWIRFLFPMLISLDAEYQQDKGGELPAGHRVLIFANQISRRYTLPVFRESQLLRGYVSTVVTWKPTRCLRLQY